MARTVCVLTSAHPAFDVRIFHKQCKSLARAGYQVTLVAQATEDGEHEGIALRALPIWKSRMERFARGAIAVYRKAREVDADVYHFHDPELIPVGLLLRLRGKRVIYDSHENLPRTISYKPYIPRIFCGTVSRIVGFLENRACRWFSALVTATDGIAHRFRRFNDNVVVINNYPRIEEIENTFSPGARVDTEPALLYVGMRITRARGAEEMVRAIGLLPKETRARLRLVGNWDSPELPAALSKIPGWDRVTFVGPLGRREVATELQNAAAGLVILHPEPNYVTSQPVKLFEYMCAGLPVIVSDFPDCREIVDDAGCGILVNPFDPKEIAGAMEFLLAHPKEASEMGRRGHAAVRARYSWTNEEKTLLRLYSELFRHDALYEDNLLRRRQTA